MNLAAKMKEITHLNHHMTKPLSKEENALRVSLCKQIKRAAERGENKLQVNNEWVWNVVDWFRKEGFEVTNILRRWGDYTSPDKWIISW